MGRYIDRVIFGRSTGISVVLRLIGNHFGLIEQVDLVRIEVLL